MSSDSERYIFEAEWYDKISYTLRKFLLYYFPSDNSVEIFDLKTKKTFLRRTKCDDIDAKDFYVGATVTIYSRSIKLINFGDKATKEKLACKLVKTFAVLKTNVIDKMGEIFKYIINQDIHISNIKMAQISHEDALQIFEPVFMTESLRAGPVVALELVSKRGESAWQELRTVFEQNGVANSIYISNNDSMQIFFSLDKEKKRKVKNTAKLQNCTCCIIKPHAVQSRLLGEIVHDIQKANFIISAIQQFSVDPANAEEFLEVYKSVLPDYAAMVGELQSGPCIAMEISHKDPHFDVITEFRKFCGPMDPEMAKQLRPNTLRAKYGKSKIQNAVHCSDLAEDGLLEVEYFFKILDND